jgi:hypothetical protein
MGLGSHLTERAFAKAESAYNDTTIVAGLAAGDGFLHRQIRCGPGKWNRVRNPGRRATPDTASMLDRRMTADWNASVGWEPSGVLGTASELGTLLTALFGTKVASGSGSGVTTTVSASPSPTATGCTVASATGLAVGDIIVVTMPLGHREATRIKTINTAALTFDSLSVAPASGAAVVAGVTYKLATQTTPVSLAIAKQDITNSAYEGVSGALVNSGSLVFDGNEEAAWQFSGPAARYYTSGLTIPSSITRPAGAAPLAGINAGNVYLDATAFLCLRAGISIGNNFGQRTGELGVTYASGAFRSAKRDVSVDLTYFFDATTLRDLAMAKTASTVRALIGSTNGSMLAFVLPSVAWEIEDVPTGDSGPKNASSTGTAIAVSGNDEIYVAEV